MGDVARLKTIFEREVELLENATMTSRETLGLALRMGRLEDDERRVLVRQISQYANRLEQMATRLRREWGEEGGLT